MPERLHRQARRGTIAALRCWQGSTLGRLPFRTPCRSVQGLGPCADAPRVCGPGDRACTASKGRDEPEQGRGPADAARAACRGRQRRAGRNGGRGAGVAGMPARAASLRQMDRADFFFLPLKAAPGKDSALFFARCCYPARAKRKKPPPQRQQLPASTNPTGSEARASQRGRTPQRGRAYTKEERPSAAAEWCGGGPNDGHPAGARPEGEQTLPESRPAPKKPPAKRGVQGGFQIKSRPARAAFHSTPPRRGGASADRGQPGQGTPRLRLPSAPAGKVYFIGRFKSGKELPLRGLYLYPRSFIHIPP